MVHNGISRMLILIPTLFFWFSNPFWANLGAKNSKLSVLSKNWYTWYLKDAGSYSNIYFVNFQFLIPFWTNLDQKSCSFCLKVGIHCILRMLTLLSTFVFLILNQKGQICPFYLKIGTLDILMMRILITRLVSWILKPKFI